MSNYDGSLNFNTKIDEKGFNKGTASMSKSLKKLAALIVAAFSVKQLVKFGRQALTIASQLQEVQNIVDEFHTDEEDDDSDEETDDESGDEETDDSDDKEA